MSRCGTETICGPYRRAVGRGSNIATVSFHAPTCSVFVTATEPLKTGTSALFRGFKSLLDTKAGTLKEIIRKFMGDHLTPPQVEGALQQRGLDITALEHFNKEDFRHLLDGIENLEPQLQGLVASGSATFEQKKDNVAAAYEAARVAFQKTYTKRTKSS
jgi:hypothetical protein